MVGNAAEEGLLSQVDNPSHGDPLRVVSLASFVAGGATYLMARWLVPTLTIWGAIVLGMAVCLGTAWVLARFSQRRTSERKARELKMRRTAQEVETEERLAAMRDGKAPTESKGA